MTESLVYLASPYSDPDPSVRAARHLAACRCTAAMMRDGLHVFSPIVHGYALEPHGLPGDWAFWQTYDRLMLSRCNELAVLCLPGWRESVGVQAEVALAKEMALPVRYMQPRHSEWRDASVVLPPVGERCEVLCGQDAVMRATLVRLPGGGYAWANGENNDYRVGGVRCWRRETKQGDSHEHDN